MADLELLPGKEPKGELVAFLSGHNEDRFLLRYAELFIGKIANDNTRDAYRRAFEKFLTWCQSHGIGDIRKVTPVHVGLYIRGMNASPPTVKQNLAALRRICDEFVEAGLLPSSPAASIRSPRQSTAKGKTPILATEEVRLLLDSIPSNSPVGRRDRALIATMFYTFARVGAVVNMKVGEYFSVGKRKWIRLHEKGGKVHEVPVHHTLEEILDTYLETLAEARKDEPLFRTALKSGNLTQNTIDRGDAFRMVRRRAQAVGITADIGCHSFRATGITTYLKSGGTIEHAQRIAAHSSPATTKLYDRTNDDIAMMEIERLSLTL